MGRAMDEGRPQPPMSCQLVLVMRMAWLVFFFVFRWVLCSVGGEIKKENGEGSVAEKEWFARKKDDKKDDHQKHCVWTFEEHLDWTLIKQHEWKQESQRALLFLSANTFVVFSLPRNHQKPQKGVSCTGIDREKDELCWRWASNEETMEHVSCRMRKRAQRHREMPAYGLNTIE